MNMKKFVYLAFALALTACGGDKSAVPTSGNDYAVVTVQPSEATLNTSYPATIKGIQDIEIRPRIAGNIMKVLVDEGDFVRAGQPLFIIDKVQYEAAVKSAVAAIKVVEANIATQELTVKNKRMLHEKAIISQYDLETAENQLQSLKAQLAQSQAQLTDARNNLSYCTVTSPSDGVVGTIPYRVGSLVSSSSALPLTTVSNISKMYVYFSMTEKQMLDLTRENGGIVASIDKMPQVNLMLADGTQYSQPGTITAISGVIDQTTGSVQIRATFDNSGKVLRSGGTGSVLVPTHATDAIIIPQKATYEIQDKRYVYLVGKDNKVKNTEITVLPQNDGTNRLVVEGVNSLKDGMQINPITPQQADQNRAKAQKDLKEGKMPGQ